jgi:hypothetical protein
MTGHTAMRGEEIYDQELDLTAVTDFGFSLDDLLAGRKRFHCREPGLTSRSMGAVRGASRAGRMASTFCESALMGAWSSTCT